MNAMTAEETRERLENLRLAIGTREGLGVPVKWETLADRLGMSPASVSHYKSGRQPLSERAARQMVRLEKFYLVEANQQGG
jgi:transcriptional regulator with XRE-family HTH domain